MRTLALVLPQGLEYGRRIRQGVVGELERTSGWQVLQLPSHESGRSPVRLGMDSLDGGNVIVNDGGILDADVALPGNLTLGSTTGAGLVIDPTTAGSANVGQLTLAGTNTVYLSRLPAGAGTADVIGYSIITGSVANFIFDPAATLRNAPLNPAPHGNTDKAAE